MLSEVQPEHVGRDSWCAVRKQSRAGVRPLPTLRKKDSRDLSYPAAAAPRFLGMLVSILALCRVQLDPTKHRLASPSCTSHMQHGGNSVSL